MVKEKNGGALAKRQGRMGPWEKTQTKTRTQWPKSVGRFSPNPKEGESRQRRGIVKGTGNIQPTSICIKPAGIQNASRHHEIRAREEEP